jgi:hypothetical protein
VTNLVRKALPADAAPLLDLIQHAAFEQATANISEDDIALVLNAREPPAHLIVVS